MTPIKRTLDNIKDPLFRYFEREVNLGAKLLEDMRQDLNQISEICEGNRKQTNDLRLLIEQLAKGVIPASWNRYGSCVCCDKIGASFFPLPIVVQSIIGNQCMIWRDRDISVLCIVFKFF